MCDTSRFGTDDPVEWEVFRTQILRDQGWQLHRVWTPHFFRDPAACMEAILRDVDEAVAAESERRAKATVVDVPPAPVEPPRNGGAKRRTLKKGTDRSAA